VLDLKNITIDRINQNKRINSNFVRMKNLMDVKMASYLRYLGTKNAINRASDYHYLVLAVTDSTAPVNGIDYIHPTVKPVVDYATAVITKGLVPNGEVSFDFVADTESDSEAARQASEMVSTVINEQNDPHFILERWVMDACMHKNGMMMIMPVREAITRYVETQGTADQLRAFEQQAAESGLTALRQSRRRKTVELDKVMAELQQNLGEEKAAVAQAGMDNLIAGLVGEGDEEMDLEAMTADVEQSVLNDAIARNTIY